MELALTTISVDGDVITPTTQATHIGVVRSPEVNGPNIVARLAANIRAVYSVLHAGLGKGHRTNPAA